MSRINRNEFVRLYCYNRVLHTKRRALLKTIGSGREKKETRKTGHVRRKYRIYRTLFSPKHDAVRFARHIYANIKLLKFINIVTFGCVSNETS